VHTPPVDTIIAAQYLADAEALLIGAGAGMGVDSGLPAFRGTQGFWSAYPAYQGRSFMDIATPETFTRDPELAWGFYGHRLNLYRQHPPYAGFAILRRWAASMPLGSFVMTSNVDGHFQWAGFAPEQVYECHGSIHYLQCHAGCPETWPADAVQLDIDPHTFRARSALPRCPQCGALARPNILMFYDGDWQRARYESQHRRYKTWLRTAQDRRLVAIELGAGTTIATVRRECEYIAWKLIRINPHETEPPARGVLLPVGALEALTALETRRRSSGSHPYPSLLTLTT
jgi:NAD-dependent SIR2 family protein deacetylase